MSLPTSPGSSPGGGFNFMEYIHIRNLEKYHPGYKDRTLQWAKVYCNMASGDPETELLDEIDWSRLLKFILLELRAQKPLPLNDNYLRSKGFDLKKRPISLTLKMLHNFIEVVTMSVDKSTEYVHVDKIREEKKREDKMVFDFEVLWLLYPKKLGKSEANRFFNTQVKTQEDYSNITTALENFLASDVVRGDVKFIPHGSTWFNERWRDYVDITHATGKSQAMIDMERMIEDDRKRGMSSLSKVS